MKLNIGCGRDIRPDFVNVDIVDLGGNIVHDLTVFPWPFADDSADEILAIDIIEHIPRGPMLVNAINEIIRILKVGGVGRIQVPDANFAHPAWTDPTHHGGFTKESLCYWDQSHPYCKAYGAYHNKGKYFITDQIVSESNHNLTFVFLKG